MLYFHSCMYLLQSDNHLGHCKPSTIYMHTKCIGVDLGSGAPQYFIIQIMDGLESDLDFWRTKKSYIWRGAAESNMTSESIKNPYWTTEPSINCYIMPKNSLVYSIFLANFWWILLQNHCMTSYLKRSRVEVWRYAVWHHDVMTWRHYNRHRGGIHNVITAVQKLYWTGQMRAWSIITWGQWSDIAFTLLVDPIQAIVGCSHGTIWGLRLDK
jgi:hypothetical protein